MARNSHTRSVFGARSEQAGLLVVAANTPLTFQRTLMPRSNLDQALVTGLAAAINTAFVGLIQESIQATALQTLQRGRTRGERIDNASRAAIVFDLGAVGLGMGIQKAFAARNREPLPRAAIRTGGFMLSVTGTAGALVGLLQETPMARKRGVAPVMALAAAGLATQGEFRRRRGERLDAGMEPEEANTSALKAAVSGLAVAAVATGFGRGQRRTAEAISRTASRFLPGSENIWRPVGHAVTLAGLVLGTRALMHQAYSRIASKEESVEAAFDIPPPNPMVSGSLDSLVPFETISKQGRRYAWFVLPRDRIETIMDAPDAVQPARAYIGLESADTEEARVALAIQELDRVNAFDRSALMLVSPTGTGYVNYAAVSIFEFLNRGDCATLTMQYSARPSPLSLDRVNEGRHHMRLLLEAVSKRLQGRPEGKRPRVMLFGESLGAWTSQDPFVNLGTKGLEDFGVDHAIWIGTPHFSKWKEQVLNDDRPEIDRSLVGRFHDIGEYEALDEEARSKVRYVMITHHEDGVAVFGPELMVQAPEWLGDPAERAATVPPGMRWMPTTAFLQVLVDMKNSATVVPGVFMAKGHDYRADLLPFFHQLLGLPATPAQLEAIRSFLEAREKVRSDWIGGHGKAGQSMSATIVRRWMDEQHGKGGDETLARIVREVAEEQFSAGGGSTNT